MPYYESNVEDFHNFTISVRACLKLAIVLLFIDLKFNTDFGLALKTAELIKYSLLIYCIERFRFRSHPSFSSF